MTIISRARITVVKVDDGYTITLAPASVAIPANFDGSSPVLTAAKTKVLLSRDGSDIPITIDSLVPTGCTATFAGNVVTITAIPNGTDSGEILINFHATDNSYTSSAVFSFSKSKQGTAGADGYTVILSNEAHALPASHTGEVSTGELEKALSGVQAFSGSLALTPVAYNATPGIGQFRYNITGVTGGTANRIDNSSFVLVSITETVAKITVAVNCENKVTINKVMTITKTAGGSPGNPGENGNYTEFRFAVNGSTTAAPSLVTTDPAPSGWDTAQPAVGTAEYLWVTSAVKNAAGALLSNWSPASRSTGINGTNGTNGTNGAAGIPGPFVTHTGNYDNARTYNGSTVRLEVVKYSGNFYVTRSDAGAFSGVLPTNTAKWNLFGAQFDSIATGLLLTELALIQNLIVQYLRTGATGTKRIEIDALLNNIRLYNEFDQVLVEIDDDAALESVSLDGGVPTYTRGPGLKVGISESDSGGMSSVSRKGVSTNGKFSVRSIGDTTGEVSEMTKEGVKTTGYVEVAGALKVNGGVNINGTTPFTGYIFDGYHSKWAKYINGYFIGHGLSSGW